MHARDRGGQGTSRRLARKMPIRVKRAGVSLGQGGERRGGNANLPLRAAGNRFQTGLKGGGLVRLRRFMRLILETSMRKEHGV